MIKFSCLQFDVILILKGCLAAAINEMTILMLQVENYIAFLRKSAFENCA